MTKGLYFPNVRLYYPYRQYTNRVLISSYLYLYRMSGINRNYIIRDLILGYVHTNPFSYASVFDPTKTDTNIRVHTSVFESFSTVHNSYEIRYVFVLRGRLIIKFMTSAFSKTFVFARPH